MGNLISLSVKKEGNEVVSKTKVVAAIAIDADEVVTKGTGDTTIGTAVNNVSDEILRNAVIGDRISGGTIPAGATIASFNVSAKTITLSAAATAAATGVALTVTQTQVKYFPANVKTAIKYVVSETAANLVTAGA